MRSKAIFMALLALAFVAQGASVSRETAELAARGWAMQGGMLGARIGSQVESSTEHVTTNGAAFYSVKMWGGGTVFMSSDTEMEPVVAFTDSPDDFSEIDPKSPLWALLNRDMSARRAALDSLPVVLLRPKSAGASSSASSSAGQGQGGSTTADTWAALIERGSEPSSGIKQLLSASISPRFASPGDLRVPALMESTWDQAEADGRAHKSDARTCYNYYTPQDGTGVIQEGKKENAVCGCVATAMGQIMFYHKYPASANAAAATDSCWFSKYNDSGRVQSTDEIFLPVSGDPYDWDNMVASPWSGTSLESRKAIGRLTADAGRSVGMAYSSNDSGSFTFKASKAIVDVFRFGQSVYAEFDSKGNRSDVGALTGDTKLGKIVYSNLDAGYPVLFGIQGSNGGHEIVADGYGYQGDTPYVHLNMGWSGDCNIWYNLPNIDTRSSGGSFVFTVVDDAAYNMIPHGAGLGVMSGRVVDEDGNPLDDAVVSVYDTGTDALVTQLVTTAYGVWGAALPGGSYRVVVVDAENTRSAETQVALQTPVQTDKEFSWVTPKYEITNDDADAGSGVYPIVVTTGDLGNSWGNDLVLEYPRVRIVVGAETNIYVSLDAAISGAREIAESSASVPAIEILRAVGLKSNATIDFDCEIRAATGDESSTLVSMLSGARLTVASGAELYMSNCVFEASEGVFPIFVSAGGRVFVGPGYSGDVSTADTDGFNVIGHVTSDIAVDCQAATVVGRVFGHATTDDIQALSNSVAQIYAAFDDDRETRGVLKAGSAPGVYNLVWEGIPLPPEFSAGYYVDKNGKTNAFGRVDKLFEMFKNAADGGMLGSTREIVVVGYDENGLSDDLVVTSPLVLRGMGDARLKPGTDSHVYVESGGSLVVKDIVIGDRTWDTFVYVRSGGEMTLGYGAVLTNLVCTANMPKKDPGPIAVESGGVLRLETGSEIVGCAATGSGGTKTYGGGENGGGVYVYAGGTLDLAGGHIRNCRTDNGFGGGVYAKVGANVVVSGPSVVSGNISSKSGITKQEDVYFNGQSDTISVTNYVSGGSIGIRYQTSTCNETNFVFATASSADVANDAATNAPALFFNDVNPMLVVGVTNKTGLAWFVPDPPSPPAEALVALLEIDGGATITNGSLQTAFERLAASEGVSSATLTLCSNSVFTADLVVPGGVALRLKPATSARVTKFGDCSIVVGDDASLVVSGIVFDDFSVVPSEKPFFSVAGGSLEFLSGTEVSGVMFDGRYAAAVTVRDGEASGGTFVMHDGVLISNCTNLYQWTDNTAYSAGLFVNGKSLLSVARLDGGTITGCEACRTGGAYVGNKGRIYLSGDVTIAGNSSTSGADANLSVAAGSGLVLKGPLTGLIGVRRDANADKVSFGLVDAAYAASASPSNVVASAMHFDSDDGYGYGIAARKDDGDMYLVWSENYDDDGTYTPVSDPSVPFPVDPPTAAVGLVYSGLAQTGVVGHVGYVLSGVPVATNAGAYRAVATLSSGYVWSDGSEGEKTNDWTIAKGTLDMSRVVFEDKTVNWDGSRKTLTISGTLPDGVTVSYSPTGGVTPSAAPGAYKITAKFRVADANYYSIADRAATLTIVKTIAQPSALKDLVYNAAAQSGVATNPSSYSLSGDVSGTNAGVEYTTVVTPGQYYVWGDGSTNALRLTWSIAPAQLTIVASNAWKLVGMEDPVLVYGVDGLQGDDTADEVLTGSLGRAAGEAKGTYAINQGTLSVKPGNQNYVIGEDGFTTAFFRILDESPEPPSPEPKVDPLPIAFTAVVGDSGTWTLTITSAVEKCWYSLYETNSLSGGFKIDGVEPVTNRQATAGDVPTMTFERPSNGSQLFWKVRAESSDAH